jgi:hypothetical protein
MAKQTLKFDDVLEPPKTVEVGGTSYRLAPDIPTEIVVLQAKLEIEQLKAQNELDTLAQREIDEDNVEQVRGAIDEADEITRRMSQLEDSAKTQILAFFNDPEYRLAEVEQLPLRSRRSSTSSCPTCTAPRRSSRSCPASVRAERTLRRRTRRRCGRGWDEEYEVDAEGQAEESSSSTS